MDREVQEWLSLAPADLLCYTSYGCLFGLYFTPSGWPDWTLGGIALLLSLIACPIGMRPHDQLSAFTNAMKLICYPLNAALVLIVIIAHAWLNDGAWRNLLDAIST
ncbi:MAG: hypothetical protein AAGA25_01870 [Planctomycetota bacterium]